MQLSWACIIKSRMARLSRSLCASLVASRLSASDGYQAPCECLSSNKDNNYVERMMLAPRKQADNTVALVIMAWRVPTSPSSSEVSVSSPPPQPQYTQIQDGPRRTTMTVHLRKVLRGTRNATSHGHRRIVGIVAAVLKVEVALQSQSSRGPSASSEQR